MAYTTIPKSSDYFNTVTYSGSETPQTITGVNFSADMAWFKNRTGTAAGGNIYDTVRGISDGWLYTNETAVSNNAGQPQITLNSDGYVLNTGYDLINDGASTYVSWNWLGANGTSANTDGSISSTVSANTTSGFSIVKFTGTGANATVGHGLGAVPKMIIVKNTTASGWSWLTYHVSIGATKNLYLNNTDTPVTSSDRWQDTTPTSSVFYLGSNGGVNGSGNTMIAYCFADVQGYSKFGSYVGNGNADGPFIYTGFKPAFVLTKNTSNTNNWTICDNKRNTFNPTDKVLNPNINTTEAVNNPQDFVSNGIKNRATESNTNQSGATYIYMAFAEQPLVGDNPATAR